jgi:hypothetical protein
MSALSRTSALASRHAALGSGLEDWNDMGTATLGEIPFSDPTKSRTQI